MSVNHPRDPQAQGEPAQHPQLFHVVLSEARSLKMKAELKYSPWPVFTMWAEVGIDFTELHKHSGPQKGMRSWLPVTEEAIGKLTRESPQ